MPEIQISTINKLMKKSGATQISKLAKEELRDHVEQYIIDISSKAWKHAKMSRQDSITLHDISVVLEDEELF